MAAVQDASSPRSSQRSWVIRPPRPGNLGWVVHRHGVAYAEEQPGASPVACGP